jgi:hypothetical protein
LAKIQLRLKKFAAGVAIAIQQIWEEAPKRRAGSFSLAMAIRDTHFKVIASFTAPPLSGVGFD